METMVFLQGEVALVFMPLLVTITWGVGPTLPVALLRQEKHLLKIALERTNWNRKKAAELLDISYKSLLNKIKAYDLA